jgi:iron complex outermembrane receptor protein
MEARWGRVGRKPAGGKPMGAFWRHRSRSWRLAIALTVLVSEALYAGTSITGKVHDAGGRPLKDVTITDLTSNLKTFSNAQGEFTVRLAESSGVVHLLFESPGYYPETLLYKAKEPAASVDVVLTPRTIIKQTVKVVASRLDISLATNPAATTVVGPDLLDEMPRSVAIDEPLKAVPGVKVDNQANGERVHLSIRGQGILSERGIRGTQVLYDGVPLNDPSGFCPDVYDVDWAGVEQVNVVRGPVAFLYGGGSAAGVIDIHTRAAEAGPLHGGLWAEGGSNGFYKTRGEVSGRASGVAYLISASRAAGDGYRQHTAFWANNVYGRLSFNPRPSLRLSPFIMGTGFFNQNAEGLNLNWGYPSPAWWKMANPDALTYNEYQKTLRATGGLNGEWVATDNQRVSFTFYTRQTAYKEPVPSSVEHRNLTAPGGSLQYEVDSGHGRVKNRFSTGLDLDGQWVDDLRHPNIGNAVETPELLANQSITQKRVGAYWTDRLSVGRRWTLLGSLRWDHLGNSLIDHLRANGLDLSGSRDFTKATGRLGVTWSATQDIALFASWGQGFLPPATEELYANPAALGGFNKSLVPATSMGEEVGVRGNYRNHFFWETELFRLDTKNDFERYRIAGRPLETFYGNAGESRRYGVETELRWLPVRQLTVTAAYTYSHFIYTQYTSLTYPGNLTGNDLPNSPRHQAFVDTSYEFAPSWFVGASAEGYSRAFIDPTNRTWIDAYGLLNARFSKTWKHHSVYGTFFVVGKNLTGKRYIAFTEPDPDGNSYQPGANREFFAGLRIRF